MPKKVLVTGGSGRLGNYVSPHLKSRGYLVTNFDVVPSPEGSACAAEKIPFVRGNLTDLGDCMRAVAHAQPDVIVHLGAIAHNTETQPAYAMEYNKETQTGSRFIQVHDEDETMKTNVMGTYYLLDAARRLGVKRVVAASSYFVLGIGFRLSGTPYIPDYLPMDEEHPCTPQDTYSLSKLLDEEILKGFARAYGIRSVALRLLGVYYPDSERHRQMYQFNIEVPAVKEGETGYMNNTTYQYVHARDVAAAVELSIEAENLGEFEPFFLATDTLYTEPTAAVIAKRWPPLAEKGKDIRGTDGVISIERARRLLHYEPAHSWRGEA